MAFGIYVHIPYCIQRCTYCDFATYSQEQLKYSQILPPSAYLDLLKQEIAWKAPAPRQVDTIYFGGGTPSLVPAEMIVSVLQELARHGLAAGPASEITIEINPATIDEKKMELYLKHGINRFSVGAQTFNDPLLKSVNREHSSEQTRATLSLLKSYGVNYSFDILFALPGQTLAVLREDLQEVLEFKPHHVSPYCLTVPEGHVLSRAKLPEEEQLKMFELIADSLSKGGYDRYEISNFCLPGYASRHNSLYWDDEEYWGIGLSAHSYLKDEGWGRRFWNPKSMQKYQQVMENKETLPEDHFEKLELHQSLTDFCHVSLRRSKGLLRNEFERKFNINTMEKIKPALAQLVENGLLRTDPSETRWQLTEKGILLSNQVFGVLTFLRGELGST
jgi:oxygen-independent coproporphyrinogen III oxidase